MADTQRSRAALLVLFADNVTGQISAQDLRDYVVTVMEQDFQFAGDFWTEPKTAFTTTDKTGRGWIDYSQVAGSDVVFGEAVHFFTTSGVWRKAMASNSLFNPCMGIALNTYASNATDMQVLRRGLIYNSALSGLWSGQCGKPIYLISVAGSVSYTHSYATLTWPPIVGLYEGASFGVAPGSGHFRFDPMWFVTGS